MILGNIESEIRVPFLARGAAEMGQLLHAAYKNMHQKTPTHRQHIDIIHPTKGDTLHFVSPGPVCSLSLPPFPSCALSIRFFPLPSTPPPHSRVRNGKDKYILGGQRPFFLRTHTPPPRRGVNIYCSE